MATRDPVNVSTSWTLVYDANDDGAFSGCVQISGPNGAVMRVMEGSDPPDPSELTGIVSSAIPTPTKLAATESLWIRAINAPVVAILG
jgi:hypothetical protein